MQLELNSRQMVKYLGMSRRDRDRGDPSLSPEGVSKRKKRSLRGQLKETLVPSKGG